MVTDNETDFVVALFNQFKGFDTVVGGDCVIFTTEKVAEYVQVGLFIIHQQQGVALLYVGLFPGQFLKFCFAEKTHEEPSPVEAAGLTLVGASRWDNSRLSLGPVGPS